MEKLSSPNPRHTASRANALSPISKNAVSRVQYTSMVDSRSMSRVREEKENDSFGNNSYNSSRRALDSMPMNARRIGRQWRRGGSVLESLSSSSSSSGTLESYPGTVG